MGESFTKEAEEMDEELLSDAIRREQKRTEPQHPSGVDLRKIIKKQNQVDDQ